MFEKIDTLLTNSIKSDFATLLAQNMPNIFPALSICVIYQGDVVLQDAWGWVDADEQTLPVTPSSYFDLASVTKLFVETTFLTFVNNGKVSLDSKLVDVVPQFGDLNRRAIGSGQDPHTRQPLPIEEKFRGRTVDVTQVTFKHLLTHTSGLPPWRDVFNRASDSVPAPPTSNTNIDPRRWGNALRAICEYPFVGTIGDTVRYSDIGILLLGEAVARLNETSLDVAVQEHVCQPLGLQSVTYNPILSGLSINQIIPTEFDSTWRKRRAWGEVHDENACGVGGVAGHAGLFATARDVAQFGQVWLSGHPKLNLSDDIRQLATQQHANGQFRLGLGWMLKAEEGSSAGDLFSMSSYGHTGFTGTSLWIDPEQEIVSAVLTNRVYPGRQIDGIHAFRRAIHDLIVRGIHSL